MRSSRLKDKLERSYALERTIFLIFSFLYAGLLFGQKTVKNQRDTLSINQYENLVLKTNNGTDCICLVNNPSRKQIAVVAIMGAPKNVRFDNDAVFNKIHILAVQEQMIAMTDFKGKELTIVNLTPYNIRIIIYFYCN